MIEIRLLQASDADLFSSIAPGVFDENVSPERVQAFLADDRHHLVVAIDGGEIVGFVSAVDYVHPDKDRELWINEVGVATTHQRRGIGQRMLGAMLDHARAIGCLEAWVLTDDDNVAARKLYSSLGGIDRSSQIMYTFFL